jgi:ribosomal protein L5
MLKNQPRLFFFKEKIFYWKFLNILRMKNIPSIKKILISFNIRDIKELEDSIVMKFFYYLEVICNQKSFLNNLVKGNIKTKVKNINLTGQISLHGIRLYSFFEYFNFFVYPSLKKNFIKINTNIDNSSGNLSMFIKDLSIFPGLSEELNNQISYPVKIDIIFENSNLDKSRYFLNEFGFY